MPMYIIDALANLPGIAGLFVGGIFSASLSTVSTALNSLAAITLEDYFKNLYLVIKKKPFVQPENHSALPSKILSTFYGVLCICVAFAMQNLGGVLQASLIVFGVVGGPLLAVFTLGMFTKLANQYGVIVGHLAGMGIAMWSQFGKPRPPPKYLSFSTDDCSAFGGLNVSKHINPLFEAADVYVEKADNQDSRFVVRSFKIIAAMISSLLVCSFFYLYRISYMYAVIIGFLVTLIVGYLTSYVLYLTKLQGMEKIYVNDSINEINAELFSPPIAKKIKREYEKKQIS